MASRKWNKDESTYLIERNEREAKFREVIGGQKEIERIAESHPYQLLKLAHECLSRAKYLPAFPARRAGWLDDPRYIRGEEFVRNYVEKALALAGDVLKAGKPDNSVEFLKRAFQNVEHSYLVTAHTDLSPLRIGATNLNHAVRFLCGDDFESFTSFIFKPTFDAVVLGTAESNDFSISLEEYALSVVAKIKTEREGGADDLGGVKMPRVWGAQAGRAFELINQLTDLIDENPSVVEDLLPKLSELTKLVEHHRPDVETGATKSVARTWATTERVIGLREAAGFLEITASTLQKFAKRNLVGELVGGRYLFSAAELEVFKHRDKSKGGRPKRAEGENTR